MDITPLYELKDRLRAAMIAGTSLLSEDFRLKKTAENFSKLESASPVFKKIGEHTDALLSDNCPDKPAALLDTITLVDSVICAMGNTEVTGDIAEIPLTETGSAIADAPYSRISPLINALTKSGSGNYETITTAWCDTPELFRDYRVKPALIKGLGASYSELAQYVIEIITGVGREMLPLLKKDFDPEGKKDMVRRAICIDKLGGAEDSGFCLEALKTAKKDLRKMLIHALRHDENNAKALIELANTEKDKCKDAAMYALGEMNCDKARDYYYEFAEHPAAVLKYMDHATADWASELTAKLINDALYDKQGNKITLSQLHADPKKESELKEFTVFQTIRNALVGKTGAKIEQIFRDFRLTIKNNPADKDMDECLGLSVFITQDENLINLAIELNNNGETKGQYRCAESIARLISREDCSEWFDEALGRLAEAYRQSKQDIQNAPEMTALHWLRYKDGGYVMERSYYDNITEARIQESKQVYQPVRNIIFSLIKHDVPAFTREIKSLNFDPNDRELSQKIGEHYVHALTEVPDTDSSYLYLYYIKDFGFANIEGLAEKWLTVNPWKSKAYIFGFLENMPGDEEYKRTEARRLIEKILSGKITTHLDKDAKEWLANKIEERFAKG